jgi:ribonuclease Z
MRLWAPQGGERILRAAVNLGVERVPFEIEVRELRPGDVVAREAYDIVAFRANHGMQSLGFALVEHERLGRFHPERARALGVPEGPLFGKLHRGEAVTVDGRTIRPEDVVGPPRPGRRVVYTGDTRPSAETVRMAKAADLLIHEATFCHDEADRARATGHSTAREAARVAHKAGAARLAVTHLSARYAEDVRPLEREIRAVFGNSIVAHDGLVIEVPYPEGDEP